MLTSVVHCCVDASCAVPTKSSAESTARLKTANGDRSEFLCHLNNEVLQNFHKANSPLRRDNTSLMKWERPSGTLSDVLLHDT